MKIAHIGLTTSLVNQNECHGWVQLDAPLSLCLVFYALVLADGFAVFHGHLGLVGTHLLALSGIVEQKATLQMLPLQACSAGGTWISHRSWMSLSCMVCCSCTLARSFLRCSHCCVTWLSFISCSSLLWLLMSSDHSLVCCAVMSFTWEINNPRMHTQMYSRTLLTDLRMLFEQKCCADKEEASYTLVLWSVASVWILSSVSFFNSWQLFSLWGDTMHCFFFLQAGKQKMYYWNCFLMISHCLPSFLDGLLQ